MELHRFLLGLDLPPRFRDWLYANVESIETALSRSDYLSLLELDFTERHRVVEMVSRLKSRVLPLGPRQASDDASDWLVLADQLQGAGDPRGELIALQASLLESGQQALSEAELIDRHREALLGPLEPFVVRGVLRLEWFMGYVAHAVIARVGSEEAAAIVHQLLAHPSGSRLRSLRVEAETWRRSVGFAPIAAALGSNPSPLTTLVLDRGDEQLELALGDFAAVFETQVSLRIIELNGAEVITGPLPPDVMSFTLRTRELSVEAARALATSKSAELERLELWPGDAGAIAELAPLLQRSRVPKLRHLSLPNAGDAIVDLLLASDLLPGLSTLDLSRGNITANGAQAIRDHARAFAHLDRLDLRWNRLGESACQALARAIPNLDAQEQVAPFDLRRNDLRGEPWW